jgi:anti-anti-sigma regulatory factor
MLRIARSESGNERTTVRLEGQVIGPWVVELEHVCAPILASGAHLVLDLSGVSFLSREGVLVLCRLRDRQVPLLNCSAFVTEQIKALEQTTT